MAESTGYDALFLTDHGKVWSGRELAALREWADHVLIFPGIEISLPESVDILVLGASDPIYESLTTPSEVFAQACADGFLTVIAHPFRWLDKLPSYCELADAIELRTCNYPSEEQARIALDYAETKNLAGVHGSDAHGLNYMNRFWLETTESFSNPQEFRRLIVSGQYVNRMRDDETILPPPYKAASMAELSDEDRLVLQGEPLA